MRRAPPDPPHAHRRPHPHHPPPGARAPHLPAPPRAAPPRRRCTYRCACRCACRWRGRRWNGGGRSRDGRRRRDGGRGSVDVPARAACHWLIGRHRRLPQQGCCARSGRSGCGVTPAGEQRMAISPENSCFFFASYCSFQGKSPSLKRGKHLASG